MGHGVSFVSPGYVLENTVCLTKSQIQNELSAMIPQAGILGRTQPGYTPLVTLLLPPGVQTCLDGSNRLCSVNSYLAPPPPTLSTAATGGSLPTGTYQVELTYEIYGTPQEARVVPAARSGLRPPARLRRSRSRLPPRLRSTRMYGWYAYITGPNGYTFKRLQASATDDRH